MLRYLILLVLLCFLSDAMDVKNSSQEHLESFYDVNTMLRQREKEEKSGSSIAREAFTRIKCRELVRCKCEDCKNDLFEKKIIAHLLEKNAFEKKEIVYQLNSRINYEQPEFVKYCFSLLNGIRWWDCYNNFFKEVPVAESLEIISLLNFHKINFSFNTFFPTKDIQQHALFKANAEQLNILLQKNIPWDVCDEDGNSILHWIATLCKERKDMVIYSKGVSEFLTDAETRISALREKIPLTTFDTMLTKKNNYEKTPGDIMQEVIDKAMEYKWHDGERIKEFAKEFALIGESNENA